MFFMVCLTVPQNFSQSNVYSFTEEFGDTIVMESDAMFFIYKNMSEYVNKVAELESERESLNQKITHYRDLIIMLMLGYVVIFLRFVYIGKRK